MKFLHVLVAIVAPVGGAAFSAAAEAFGFDEVDARARALAAQPYERRASNVPESLRRLSYDQYRDIRYRPAETWWREQALPFQLQFFHPGFLFNETVQIHEIVGGEARPVPFRKQAFDYGQNDDLGDWPNDIGYTGFKVLTDLHSGRPIDELIVFQGASYFRALGRGLYYGLSARGLALNTAQPAPEEFPVFEEFWIERPVPGAAQVTIHALLNSPSVAGAYRFVVHPGEATRVEVKLALYPRNGHDIRVAGLAPLTSMFWYGEETNHRFRDFRPEVHDSDGLLMARGDGEWVWRPLVNPPALRESSFRDEDPRGFGLLQRDRAFTSYEDLEAHYHLRPSAWVEPVGRWGAGAVRLVEIPTQDETHDNIVAFWVPAELPAPGEALRLEYRLHWFREGQGGVYPPAGYTVATRVGHSRTDRPELPRFIVDFTGVPGASDPAAADKIEVVAWAGGGGELVETAGMPHPQAKGWRAALVVRPDGSGRPVELRAFLRRGDDVLTETWTYLWPAAEAP